MALDQTFLTGRHYGLQDVRHDSLRNTIGNRCITKPAVIMDATLNTAIESAAFTFSIGGFFYSKTALSDQAVSVTDAYGDQFTQQASQTCYYAICIDSAGTITVYKGGAGKGLPGHPANLCCFSVIRIVTGATTFKMGTDAFNKALVTSTFFDVVCLPATNP